MFTINTDNCLFLFLISVSVSVSVCVHTESADLTPDPSSARRLHLVVECGIHGLVKYQSCNLNNIAVLRQRLAAFQHLRNSSLS